MWTVYLKYLQWAAFGLRATFERDVSYQVKFSAVGADI